MKQSGLCLSKTHSIAIIAVLLLLASDHGYGQNDSEADEALAQGTQALRGGDFSGAADAFSTVTRLRPQFAEGYLNLGLALEQEGEYSRAAAALQKARQLKPLLHGANLFLGIAEYQMNDYPKAEEALHREVHLSPKDSKALMWLGIVQLAANHVEAAATTLDSAAALAPKDTDILYHRGRAHLLISKASYEQMFAADPDSYRVHEVLGQADAEADRTADAIAEYKLAIERAPRQPGLHEELGDLYWISGKMDLADTAYQQELAVDSHSVVTRYKLGSLRVIVGDPKDGLPLLEAAIALDPGMDDAYYYLGRAQADMGDEIHGIENLKRATVAAGNDTLNTLAWYQLSRVYRRMHRNAEAGAALVQFQKLRDQKDKRQQAKLGNQLDRRKQLPQQEQLPTDAEAARP